MEFEVTKEVKSIILLTLKDFTPSIKSHRDLVFGDNSDKHFISKHDLPVPQLVSFILHNICLFSFGTREDKMHWSIYFNFKMVNCVISLEKFGVNLYIEKNTSIKSNEVIGKLNKAIRVLEKKALKTIVNNAISVGNVFIANRFHKLDNQYYFFRQQAKLSLEKHHYENNAHDLTTLWNKKLSLSESLSFNSIAMIDAYFSRLEHILVFALIFSNYDKNHDNISNFVGLFWGDKLKRILDFQDKRTLKEYNKLLLIKEKYRNTFAHGGFEKKGQSFYCDFDGIGVVSVQLSGFKDSVHFNHFAIDEDRFHHICNVFDGFDSFLFEDKIISTGILLKSGIDISFNESEINNLVSISKDIHIFREWLQTRQEHYTNYINTDY